MLVAYGLSIGRRGKNFRLPGPLRIDGDPRLEAFSLDIRVGTDNKRVAFCAIRQRCADNNRSLQTGARHIDIAAAGNLLQDRIKLTRADALDLPFGDRDPLLDPDVQGDRVIPVSLRKIKFAVFLPRVHGKRPGKDARSPIGRDPDVRFADKNRRVFLNFIKRHFVAPGIVKHLARDRLLDLMDTARFVFLFFHHGFQDDLPREDLPAVDPYRPDIISDGLCRLVIRDRDKGQPAGPAEGNRFVHGGCQIFSQ